MDNVTPVYVKTNEDNIVLNSPKADITRLVQCRDYQSHID